MSSSLSLEQLFRQQSSAIRRLLVRLLGCEASAQDVAQTVWLRWLRYPPGKDLDNPQGYLFRMARHAAFDHMARERRNPDSDEEESQPDTLPCQSGEPENQIINEDQLARLARQIDSLPPRCREVFLLSRAEELSNKEIALKLGISRNMVEKHIIKAMLHCRQYLADSE